MPRHSGLTPAVQAEQQRARSEIEAALTIAAARPRDEKECMDNILISCQRPGLAAKAQYEYSRGGTSISGPSIDLMEAIAQRWGNLEFGFRELARFPGDAGQPGESVVEAFAWDMQSNVRRRVQFTVQHAMKSGVSMKTLRDPRDIYEYVANQAQRRVRTCLENIIPRDIWEAACEQCDRTLKAQISDPAKAVADMLQAFSKVGVSREMIEGRIQRRLDAITPAQIIGLRKVFASVRDGMSEVGDWFKAPASTEPPKSVGDRAKEAMRQQASGTAPADAEAATPAPPAQETSFPDTEEGWQGYFLEAASHPELSRRLDELNTGSQLLKTARDRLSDFATECQKRLSQHAGETAAPADPPKRGPGRPPKAKPDTLLL